MASAQVERIAALAERLAPLAGKARGMPIEADDWNAVVEVLRGVLEIDRAQLDTQQAALAEGFAARGHEHLGQVTTTWLEPALQVALAAATASTPVQLLVAQLDRKLESLSGAVARLTELVDRQQGVVDRFAVSDLDRARAIREFDRRFAGLEDLRTLVTSVSSEVSGLRTGVTAVLDLRRSLTDATGAPIDVAGLRQEVRDLQSVREALRDANGTPLRLRDFDLRLRDVEDAAGVGAGLDARIAAVSAPLEERLRSDAVDRIRVLRQELDAAGQERAVTLRAELTGVMDARLTAADQATTTRILAAEARLRADTTARIGTATEALRREQTALTRTLVGEQLAGVPDQVRAGVAAARADLQAALRTELTAQLTAVVDARTGAVERQLIQRLGTVETALRAEQRQLEDRMQGALTTLGGALRDETRLAIEERVVTLQRTLEADVATRVSAEVTAATGALETRVRGVVDQRLGDLDARAGRAALEATRTLPDRISAEVRLQITELDVPGRLAASSTALGEQFRAELSASLGQEQSRSTAALSAAMTQLRGETAAAVRAATDEAVARTAPLVAALRTETFTAIDTTRRDLTALVNTETTRVRRDVIAIERESTVVRPGGATPGPIR
jgi:hypothetical protein